MIKKRIQVKVKDSHLVIKLKIPSNFTIDTNQCNRLSQKYNYGFAKLNCVKRNNLEFIEPKGVSLHERLKKTISEYDFFFIIEQLVDITQKIEKIGLSRNNLVFDLKYVFFNESTKELTFIYLPIITPHSGLSSLSFVEQIIYSAKPTEIDSNYLSNFSYFMKGLNEFNADKIEAYIFKINSDIISIIKNVNLKGNSHTNKKINNEKVKAIKTSYDDELIVRTDNEKTYLVSENDYLTNHSNDNESIDSFFDNVEINSFVENNRNDVDDERTCLLDDEVTEYFANDNGKSDLLKKTSAVHYKFPTLIRTLTDEIIRIDKPVFRIGKEENCVDYIITNNPTISRSHADIISRDGKYFVFDLRSKNKSYINNRVLPTECEVEIFNGDVLKLADEEFLFQV